MKPRLVSRPAWMTLAAVAFAALLAVDSPGVRAADAGAPAAGGDGVSAEIRQMAMEFITSCWRARGIKPERVDRCYAPEGRFRAVRVGGKGEIAIPRAQWVAERAKSPLPWGINPADVVELDPPWNQIAIEPGKAAGEIVVSYVHVRARAGRQENVFRQLVLGSGAPGPSPAIVQEREEPRPLSSSPPMAPDRLPLVTARACPATVDLRGPYLVVTGAHAKYSAAIAAVREERRRGQSAEIVAGRWLLPPEPTFAIAVASFADRSEAERRVAQHGGRVLEAAPIGPSGPVPAWGLVAVGRIDGIAGPIELRGDRVIGWNGSNNAGWRLGADGLTLEAMARQSGVYPPPEMIDPFTGQKLQPPFGPRLPGQSATLPGTPARVVRYDDRRDELQEIDTAAAGARLLWALPLGARERRVQIFPRPDGLYLAIDESLFQLDRHTAPGAHLGKICGEVKFDYRPARAATMRIGGPGATGVKLDTDGSFELWAPIPAMVNPTVDPASLRCGRKQTAVVKGSSAALLTELGLKRNIEAACE